MRSLVLFPGALGDLCLLAPSLARVIENGVRVELCVQRMLMPIARLLLPAAEIGPPMDGAVMSSLFAASVDPVLAAALQRADRVHAWLARADGDGGVSARLGAYGAVASLHAVPRGDAPQHVVGDYAAMLELPTLPPPLRMAPPSGSASVPWSGGDAVRLVVHPGAGAAAKVWSPDGFRRVADDWRRHDGEVAVLLGPAEEDQAPTWAASGHAVLVGSSIVAAAAAIASAPSWLGNDSGMSHLAGALGRRGVVLFGPTRPARWRPLGGRLAVVEFLGRALDVVVRDVRAHLGAPFSRP